MPPVDHHAGQRGFLYALGAYLIWGLMPLYFKAVDHIPAVEVLVHRTIWSVPVAALILIALGRTRDIATAFRSPRTLLMAVITATIISLNWGTYIWAIANNHAVEAALGYYINPLMTVMLGFLLLKEKMSRLQMASIALAFAAVLVLTLEQGKLPWVALVLAITFAAYGYLRKTLPIGAAQGFFLEVLLLLPFALAYVLWLWWSGRSHFSGSVDIGLLMFAGPGTAIPLILYASGAKLLRFSTIGMMQYITPTMIAAVAIFVFGEPFGTARLLAFLLIWAALILYSISILSWRNGATADR